MKIFQVDSFTSEPFKGNPAAVCILKEEKDDNWMQNVAKEMNLSETAFIYKYRDGYNLKWFTPACEIDLCGHATLATAHILWEAKYEEKESEIKFYSNSGLLIAKSVSGMIRLDFPLLDITKEEVPVELIDALKIKPTFTGTSGPNFFIEVETEKEVYSLMPDFNSIAKLDKQGVIVTSKSNNNTYDIISRYFAPKEEINEDPVTGSAHCSLANYWMKKLNKNYIKAYQASERGGRIDVEINGDRVYLYGNAITIFRGELVI